MFDFVGEDIHIRLELFDLPRLNLKRCDCHARVSIEIHARAQHVRCGNVGAVLDDESKVTCLVALLVAVGGKPDLDDLFFELLELGGVLVKAGVF